MEPRCLKCEEHDPEQVLRKCSVCHRFFCEEHAYVMSGRRFCSPGCADYFFFEEPDD